MRKKTAFIIFIFCLLAGLLCACHREQETGMTVTPVPGLTALPGNTKVPSVTEEPGNHPTAAPTRELSPTPVTGPEGERIPIDEAHFTSADFRKVISDNYDTDGDGYLSDTEREAVLIISWAEDVLPEGEMQDGFQVIDGLGYFPNLRFLSAGRAGQIIIKDHPSIRGVCLARESFLYAENCPAFCSLSSHGVILNPVYISKAAQEFFWEWNWGETYRPESGQLGKWALDGELVICMGAKLPGILSRGKGGSGFYEELPVQWLERTEDGVVLLEEFWKDYFVGKEVDFYEVSVSVWEEDRKGFPAYFGEGKEDVIEDSQGRGKWVLWASDPMTDATSRGIVCYAEEMPEAEKIKLRIGEKSKVSSLDYSTERTVLGLWYELEFWYQDGKREEKIGGLEAMSCSCIIRKDGTVCLLSPDEAIFSMKEYMGGAEFTEEPAQDSETLPIDGAHFSSGIFRRYLECYHNIDSKEGLSLKERESVQVLNFEGLFRFSGETLDGLEYFPKLTDLYPGYTGTLVVENHPSLEIIGGAAPGLKRLVVRNCPELRRIDLDLSGIEEVVIEGCGKLEGKIPIDETHFTCGAFREFLSILYDTDQDGFLSLAEREAVEEIYWDDWYALEEMGISRENIEQPWHLDGFEYFPCLKSLTVISASSVALKNHPSIRNIGGGEGGIGQLLIENCPALEYIGGSMYGGAEWSVTNCENLKYFTVHDSEFGSLAFSGCPQLVLDFEDAGNQVGSLRLDADAVLTELPGGICRIVDGSSRPPFWKDGLTCENIQWENVSEQSIEMPLPAEEEDFFRYFGRDDFAYMGVQVLEKIEDIYDEQGRKGWNICIDRKENAYSKTAFSLYTEETPEPEQIFVRPAGVSKAEVLEYSPNKGVSFHIVWEQEVVYMGMAGETVLGTMLTGDRYWTIAPDGTKKGYRSEKDWKENGSRKYQAEKQFGW